MSEALVDSDMSGRRVAAVWIVMIASVVLYYWSLDIETFAMSTAWIALAAWCSGWLAARK